MPVPMFLAVRRDGRKRDIWRWFRVVVGPTQARIYRRS